MGSSHNAYTARPIFDKEIAIKQGQAPVLSYIDKLIGLVEQGKVALDNIITHTMPLS